MKYKIGDKVIIIKKSFQGFAQEILKTISDIDVNDSTYFMEEGYFWYGEDEIAGLAINDLINSRFDILDL